MKTIIKLLALVGVGALIYWLVRDRLGGEPEEFTFTEAPIETTSPEAEVPPATT